jgi:hypothetical protein
MTREALRIRHNTERMGNAEPRASNWDSVQALKTSSDQGLVCKLTMPFDLIDGL